MEDVADLGGHAGAGDGVVSGGRVVGAAEVGEELVDAALAVGGRCGAC